jgi:hypothetical protein
VLAGKAVRRFEEGTLTPWLFGRLRVLWERRAIVQQRARIIGDDNMADWGIEQSFGFRHGI